MAIRPPVDGDPSQPGHQYGYVIKMLPADPALIFELQRAPDAAGVPGTWVTFAFPGPFPLSGGNYFDPRPGGTIWWYRIRHVGGYGDPSDWLAPVSAGLADLFSRATLSESLRPPVYPLSPFETLAGESRSLLAVKNLPLIINGEFDNWEFSS